MMIFSAVRGRERDGLWMREGRSGSNSFEGRDAVCASSAVRTVNFMNGGAKVKLRLKLLFEKCY